MKQPRKLTCDGERLAVSWPRIVGQFPQGYSVGGDIDLAANRIRIASTQPRVSQQTALEHELLHYCFRRGGVKLGARLEEYVIDGIAGFQVVLLKENPELVEFLTEGLTE
jgi:hypothetical protein